jgi:uncharacterized RDD family membrane protein YckC
MMQNKIVQYLTGRKFVKKIIEHPVDLSEFKERPTPRLIAGLALMALSFVMGWPAIAALSVMALRWNEPLMVIIGGPVAYALSCAVFFVGAWLARAPHYLETLSRYIMQIFFRKLLQGSSSR